MEQPRSTPADLVRRGARVRIYSGAIGHQDYVMAEGKVIGWQSAPTLILQHGDGSQSSWSIHLPREEVAAWAAANPSLGRPAIYSEPSERTHIHLYDGDGRRCCSDARPESDVT